jgi:hypothetical protein
MPFLLIALLLQCAASQITAGLATSRSWIDISALTEWEQRSNTIESKAYGFAPHSVSVPA